MDKDKKLRAAFAGVMQFIRQEEEAQKNNDKNQWAMHGRRTIMQNNILVQRRELKR